MGNLSGRKRTLRECWSIQSFTRRAIAILSGLLSQTKPRLAAASNGVDSASPRSLRHRRTWTAADATPITRSLHRVGTIMNQAHTQDFERRNRPGIVGGTPENALANRHDDSSDEDDDNDDRKDDEVDAQDMQQAQTMLDRAQA